MSESQDSIGEAVRRAQDIAQDEGLPVALAIACAAAECGVDALAVVERLARHVELERMLDAR